MSKGKDYEEGGKRAATARSRIWIIRSNIYETEIKLLSLLKEMLSIRTNQGKPAIQDKNAW